MTVDVVSNGAAAPERELAAAPPGSLLARLRERAAAAQREHHLDLTIGGEFGDLLVARYMPLPLDEVDRYVELAGNTTNLELGIDLLVRCNLGMYVAEPGRLEPLSDDAGPVKLGPRLARLLQFPIPESVAEPTSREVVRWLFGNNGIAVTAHADRLVSWMDWSTPGPTFPTIVSSSSPGPRSSASVPSIS